MYIRSIRTFVRMDGRMLAPEHLDGFIFGIQDLICHNSELAEYEHSNSKIWHLQLGLNSKMAIL
jgi:hypothetical protein